MEIFQLSSTIFGIENGGNNRSFMTWHPFAPIERLIYVISIHSSTKTASWSAVKLRDSNLTRTDQASRTCQGQRKRAWAHVTTETFMVLQITNLNGLIFHYQSKYHNYRRNVRHISLLTNSLSMHNSTAWQPIIRLTPKVS